MLMMYVLYVCTVLYCMYVCMYECLVLYCICVAVCNLLFHTSVFFFHTFCTLYIVQVSSFQATARERALKGATVAKRSAPPSNCRSYALPATTIQLPHQHKILYSALPNKTKKCELAHSPVIKVASRMLCAWRVGSQPLRVPSSSFELSNYLRNCPVELRKF